MNRTTLILLSFLVAWSTAASPPQKEIIGYYPSWKWRSRGELASPTRIAFDKLTIINYAFFYPRPDGSITGRDSVGDALYLRCAPERALVPLAHEHHVMVMLSLGGWEDSNNFPAVAASPERRAHFAHACVGAIYEYGFDGIDIDWEFPGLPEHNGTPSDRGNFTSLLRTLKDSLTARGRTDGRTYLLSAALPSSAPATAGMDLDSLASILDMLNIMTYDFTGPWSPRSNHNCPLYPSAGIDSALCFSGALRFYRESRGIPVAKINLGVPFYGQTFTECTALDALHRGADTVHFSNQGAFYYDIAPHVGAFGRRWDSAAKVPYLISEPWKEFISYDDEESLRLKAQFVMDRDVRGIIIWEITGDMLEDGTTPLLGAVHSTLHPSSKLHH